MSDRSMSDDDLCSDCQHCTYRPGQFSSCAKNWPAEAQDDYIVDCPAFVLKEVRDV